MQTTLPGLRQFHDASRGLVADIEDIPMNLPGFLGLGEPPAHKREGDCLMIDMDMMRRADEPNAWEHCRLSQDEWLVIQSYFPKRYGIEGDPLHTLIYTDIPEPVLDLWAKAKMSGAFYTFQVRTTEGQGADAIASIAGTLDPILIGFVHDKMTNRLIPHRLAQWGLDNVLDASMPRMARRVAELCRLKAKTLLREQSKGLLPEEAPPIWLFLLWGLIGILGVLALSKIIPAATGDVYFGVSLGIAFGGFMSTACIQYKWTTFRSYRSILGKKTALRAQTQKILEYQAARRILANA